MLHPIAPRAPRALVFTDDDVQRALVTLASSGRLTEVERSICAAAAARLERKNLMIGDLCGFVSRVRARCERRCWSDEGYRP